VSRAENSESLNKTLLSTNSKLDC